MLSIFIEVYRNGNDECDKKTSLRYRLKLWQNRQRCIMAMKESDQHTSEGMKRSFKGRTIGQGSQTAKSYGSSLRSEVTIQTSRQMHFPSSSGYYCQSSPLRHDIELQREQNSLKSIESHYSSFIASINNKYGYNCHQSSQQAQEDRMKPKYRGGWQLETIPQVGTLPPKRRVSKAKASTVVPSLRGTTIYSSSLTYKPKPGTQVQTSKSTQYDIDDPKLELKLMNQNLKFDKKRNRSNRHSKEKRINLLPKTVDIECIDIQ